MKIQMRRVCCFVVGAIGLGVAALVAGSAAAAPIQITLADFSGSETVIDFNIIAPGTPITNQYQAQGVTFSGGLYGAFPFFGQAANFPPFTSTTNPITIDFSSTMLQAGFDVITNGEDDLLVQVSAFSGNTLVQTGQLIFPTGVVASFAGLRDTEGIDRLVLDAIGGGTGGLVFDNFRFEAAAIPEPSAALLFSAGLILAGSCIRRRQRTLA